MTAPFRVEVLAEHDRTGFGCGEEVLDRYLKTLVTQDVRRHITNCFVAGEVATGGVAGASAALTSCGAGLDACRRRASSRVLRSQAD